MEIFEAMNTARAIRKLKPDPVSKELIRELIYYATRASNPQNSQLWEFIIVQDGAKKKRISKAIHEGFQKLAAASGMDTDSDSAANLTSHFAEVPAIIFICGRNEYPPWGPDERFVASACYPAGQNLILAARALGLGTTFTMLHTLAEEEIRDVLKIPNGVTLALTIPVGYPDKDFGPVKRKPVDEVIHWDTY